VGSPTNREILNESKPYFGYMKYVEVMRYVEVLGYIYNTHSTSPQKNRFFQPTPSGQ